MIIEKKTFKIANILILIIILFVCCVIVVQNPSKYTFALLPSKYLVSILSILGIVTIPYLSNYLIKLIFSKKAFFEINEKGIYNGLSFIKQKQINWENVKSIDVINYQGILRVRIKLNNYDSFIDDADFIAKLILKQTIRELETPILIDNVYLKCSFEMLSKIIFDYYKKYKGNGLNVEFLN
jgi:hypothetical protein